MQLGREVAVKILPADMADDRERLARFRREAHRLATLNHPHVAAIYVLQFAGSGFDTSTCNATDHKFAFVRR